MSATMTGSTTVLSPGEAMALGDVLNAITQKRKIRWMDPDGETIRSGEMRALVAGDNDFAQAPWGTDVRDMWVWVTMFPGVETTVSVAHLVAMVPEGGLEILEPAQ
jgi:hypothetical protein